MKKFKIVNTYVKEVESFVCDVCGRVADITSDKPDFEEFNEFHTISFQGGFGSVFGDGNFVECDICQHCLETILGKYLRISEADNDSRNEDLRL